MIKPYLRRTKFSDALLGLLLGFTMATRLIGEEGTRVSQDSQPVVVWQVAPEYPKEAKDKTVKGEAVIEFIVGIDGTVETAQIVRQSDEPFGKAALACVKKWLFKPGMKAGVPVRSRLQIPITFSPK